MTSSLDNVSMAVFCDFENVALGVRDAQYEKFDIKLVLERLLLKGSIVVKKAYCDWDRYKNFKATMHEANFELIEIPHVRQSGKNSADIRLVVDALDLCYTKSHVDTFVIVSGDSDFSPLVSKLRENAKKVIGVGVKQSTSDLLIANCDEFIFYDDLVREIQRAAAKRETRAVQAAPARKTTREDDSNKKRRDDVDTRRTTAVEIVSETFEALVAERGDSGKIWASVLKEAIKRRKPDFNEAYYGFRAFGNLLEEAQSRGLLEVGRDDKSGTFVYRGTGAGSGMGGHGGLHDAPMGQDVASTSSSASASASSPAQPASDEPSGREPRRRTRGGRRGERRDDPDTPGLFEDGGDAMAGAVVSHDAKDPVVDLPAGGGSTLPYVRFDPDAMQAVARAANAQGGDPFSRAEGNQGLDAEAEGARTQEDAGESASGEEPAAVVPSTSASSRRQPRGRRNAASSRAERDEAGSDTNSDAGADAVAGTREASDGGAAPVTSASALSNADAEVTSGSAGFLVGMDESPAPVGRRPGARSPRSSRGERRTGVPVASDTAMAGVEAPASTPGDTGAPPASSANVTDTQAPAEPSPDKPASKSARKAPARSRRPRKAPEG